MLLVESKRVVKWLLDNVGNSFRSSVVITSILLFSQITRSCFPYILENWKDGSLVRDGNLMNTIFVNYGYIIFTALFAVLLIAHILLKRHLNYTQLPNTAADTTDLNTDQATLKSLTLRAGLRFIFVIASIWFVFWIKVLIRDQTSDIDHNGFNISGHYFMLSSFILVLAFEIKMASKTIESSYNLLTEELETERDRSKQVLVGLVNLSLGLIGITSFIWFSVLLVTGLFYHTFPEKLIGLAIGVISTHLTYCLLFNTAD